MLYITGSLEDAIKAYSNANDLKKEPKALYSRAKCYLCVGNIEKALEDLEEALKINPNEPGVSYDKEFLTVLS